MTTKVGYNEDSINGSLLNERVLKDDGVTTALATSVNRAVINHIVYFLRDYFSDVIINYSSTSSDTTLTIRGKYPESDAFNDYPLIVVYSKEYATQRQFIGDIHFNRNEIVRSRLGRFQITFDCWGRTQKEIETMTGIMSRLLDDLNQNIDFLKRGFDDVVYRGTLGREFDITDKIVETVSHLDSAINVRREEIVFDVSFFYKINLPKANLLGQNNNYITGIAQSQSISYDEDNNEFTIIIEPSTKQKFFQTTIVGKES